MCEATIRKEGLYSTWTEAVIGRMEKTVGCIESHNYGGKLHASLSIVCIRLYLKHLRISVHLPDLQCTQPSHKLAQNQSSLKSPLPWDCQIRLGNEFTVRIELLAKLLFCRLLFCVTEWQLLQKNLYSVLIKLDYLVCVSTVRVKANLLCFVLWSLLAEAYSCPSEFSRTFKIHH